MSGFCLLVAYVLFAGSLIGGFSKFTQLKLEQYDIGIPWIWLALFAVAACIALAYFEVEISVRVLGAALLGELAIILIFSFGVLLQGGGDGLSAEPILPWNAFEGVAPGSASSSPSGRGSASRQRRTTPRSRATRCGSSRSPCTSRAVAVGVLYTIAAWAVVSSYGPKEEVNAAFAAGTATLDGKTGAVDSSTLTTFPASALVGQWVADAMSYLIITGSLACAMALGNAGLRYWYAMGREGILPKALGSAPTYKSPYVAVFVQYSIVAVLLLAFWFTDRAPLDAYGWLAVQGVIWIVLVQALTALSTFFYFRKHHPGEMHPVKTIAAPWIGFVAQLAVLYLLYDNLDFLASGDILYIEKVFTIGPLFFNWLGIIGVVLPLAALAYALYLKNTNRAKYETMGRFVNEGV